MTNVIRLTAGHRKSDVRELWAEYLTWIATELGRRAPDNAFDAMACLDHDMAGIGQFLPPGGCLLLAIDGTTVAGGGALRGISEGIGEVKRLYVRPAHRRQGLGRRIMSELLAEARRVEYREVRLESPRFACEAHALYRALGLHDIAYYPESECPPDATPAFVFMSIALRPDDSPAQQPPL